MESSSATCGTWRPCLLHHPAHHHYHHPPLFLCPPPLHRHHCFHIHFSPHCPLHGYLLQPNPYLQACPDSVPLPDQPNSQVPDDPGQTYPSDALMMQEGTEEVAEEDEEEPVFVLTDEWREFFAKSEAKRRLSKKQARKKWKNVQA
ncbi:uncharacterized protein LOC127813937 [Diospyros lotus]|uniref:uncharacterized protein LOC127813937 n=1 Tax=Diospyros lotus TaxID=55363 RepID=UPI002256E8B5|nr:uncharacterized protein LOC127813937 [Diospyros lotus]